MEKQNDQEMNNGRSVIEDLAVNHDQAEEVKGGAEPLCYMRYHLDRGFTK